MEQQQQNDVNIQYRFFYKVFFSRINFVYSKSFTNNHSHESTGVIILTSGIQQTYTLYINDIYKTSTRVQYNPYKCVLTVIQMCL